jgi:hypothetical protein
VRRLVPEWLEALMDRIDRLRQDATATILEKTCHRWASELVELFGETEAVAQLTVRYSTYATGRYGNREAKRRKRLLENGVSDAALNEYERVRILLAMIGGGLGDRSYLRGLDSRVELWKKQKRQDTP